jgi:MinD superfamily P-loop ATPase
VSRALRIAVASGKGGTGKTTLSVALARAVPGSTLLDLDVEEPDARLFLPFEPERVEPVRVPVPVEVPGRCDGCADRPERVCTAACAYGAIAVLPGKVLTFPELCHGCGACVDLCPRRALGEASREVGEVTIGRAGETVLVEGRLAVGEARAVPVVAATVRHAARAGVTVFDVAPGTACPVVEALRWADVAVLVTEPTPFGLHDLEAAADLCGMLDLPAGVVLNRADLGDDRVEAFCAARGLPLLLRIPFDRSFASASARGGSLLDARPELAGDLREIVRGLEALASNGEAVR